MGVTQVNHSLELKRIASASTIAPWGARYYGKESELSKDEKLPRDEDKPSKGKETNALKVSEYQPRIPFPAKVKKDQQGEQFKKFLNMFKTLYINVPFGETLAQMPRYAKFL